MHTNNCYKSGFAVALFSLVVWTFPHNSGGPDTAGTLCGTPADACAKCANVCAKTEGAEGGEHSRLSQGPEPLARRWLCGDCSPCTPVLLKSTESVVGKSSWLCVFLSPFNCSQLIPDIDIISLGGWARDSQKDRHQAVPPGTPLKLVPCL